MDAEVTGKVEFRILRDHKEHRPLSQLKDFQSTWFLGFKAAVDILIVEFRACEMHEAADTLQKVKELSWPT